MSSLVETLYYQLYNSVLLSELDDAMMYLDFLREEYEKDNTSFEPLEKDGRLKHLQDLGKIVDNGLMVKSFNSYQGEIFASIPEDEHRFSKQGDLLRDICKNNDLLKDVLCAGNDFSLIGAEYPTRYGRVDVVGQDEDTIYPIELKKNIAGHDVISQIDKYILYFKTKLINKTYSKIVGVVIANGFNDYVLKELPNLGVVLIKYFFIGDQLSLARV